METNRRGFFGLLAGVVGSSLYTVNAKEPKTLPTDESKHQLLLQLHDKQVISTKTLLENFGYDYNHELESLRYDNAANEFHDSNLPKYCVEQIKDGQFTISKLVLPDHIAPIFKRNIRAIDHQLSRCKFPNSKIFFIAIYEGNYFVVNYNKTIKIGHASAFIDPTITIEEVKEAIEWRILNSVSRREDCNYITMIACQSRPEAVSYIISAEPLELVDDFSKVL